MVPTPEAALRGVQLVARTFEHQIFPVVNAHAPSDEREHLIASYFQRLFPVVRSLSFLIQPSFFQLTLAGARNLLENLVDVVHIHHNSPADAVERIEAWEASIKLKTAEASLRYLERVGKKNSELYASFANYVDRAGPRIRTARETFWPGASPPDRWTGRNLGDDCRSADRLEPFNLEDFYETQYRQMNWNIHGSGFAGIRGLSVDGIDMVYTHSQMNAGNFAIKATTLVLDDLGILGAHQRTLEQLAADFGNIIRGVA